MKKIDLILELNTVGINDIDIVGGKNASLGEMINNLEKMGIKIPYGFVVTVEAYRQFIAYNNLSSKITALLKNVDPDDLYSLQECGDAIRTSIMESRFPTTLIRQIEDAYRVLSMRYGREDLDVAVRSSSTAEDLPDASFAGQQETFLNVCGTEDVVASIKRCFASLFTNRAISYRKAFGYNNNDVGISVCIQKMVRSDIGASGVAFSLDTESGYRDVVLINGTYGLGELVVQGVVAPDEFIVFKPTLQEGFHAIVEQKIGLKDRKMIYGEGVKRVENVATSEMEKNSFCLSVEDVHQLARWVVCIEEYYSKIHGHWCPMDVEWALDGDSNELYIVQARPETIHSRKTLDNYINYELSNKGEHDVLLRGIAVGDKIGSGRVKHVGVIPDDLKNFDFQKGDVLVTEMTDPDWEPLMKRASGIVTERGGRTCHAAIVARELGIPAIVGSPKAREILKDKELVTVSCAEGDVGVVYRGVLEVVEKQMNIQDLPTPPVPVLLNVASPEIAFRYASLPHCGIGLARLEFIINNYIKVHPLALIHYPQLSNDVLKEYIDHLIAPYGNGSDFFIAKLAQGIAKIAASAYPRTVIVRFSDFKSNEYANLLGGEKYEPLEENPMLGWRGASRYYSSDYKEAFALECRAVRRVRNEMGLNNVIVMIPFCRTVDELLKVYEVMAENGLRRGQDGLKVYLMAELPSNFILATEFAQHVDGFSIGSNDLTQLVLGLDRDSAQVAHLYDERNSAIKMMISTLLTTAKETGVKVGICGQGPSDYPEFAQFLIDEGVDTISVTPDSFYKTVNHIGKFTLVETKTG